MTGGWPGHLLVVGVHLRPVLVELGATVPARGLYVTDPELTDLPAAVGKWSQQPAGLLARERCVGPASGSPRCHWNQPGSSFMGMPGLADGDAVRAERLP